MSTTTTLLNSLTQDLLTHNTSTPSPPQQTIKLEDIQNSPMPQTPPSSGTMPGSLSKPPTSHPKDQKTQPKKRKSWGQALPEPKTNLPPRKRAKTEDEKEQRRIERVKRNRLAAHNSRERKRQEVDELRDERDHLARENSALREIIAKYAQVGVKIELTDSQQNVLDSTETADWMTMNPRKASYDTSGPESSPSLGSIESPTDTTSQPATPAMMSIPEPDLTQHSAVSVGAQQLASSLGKPGYDNFLTMDPIIRDEPLFQDNLFDLSTDDDSASHFMNLNFLSSVNEFTEAGNEPFFESFVNFPEQRTA